MSVKQIPYTQSELLALFSYCPETGDLFWKPRLGKGRGVVSWNAKYPGRQAGGKVNGYYSVGLPCGGLFYAHRIIWKIVHGYEPLAYLDHINGNRSDNRLSNLRECNSKHENAQNTKMYARNTSGFRGVSLSKGRWKAALTYKGETIHIGRFRTPEEAHAAYLTTRQRLHAFHPVPREMERPL